MKRILLMIVTLFGLVLTLGNVLATRYMPPSASRMLLAPTGNRVVAPQTFAVVKAIWAKFAPAQAPKRAAPQGKERGAAKRPSKKDAAPQKKMISS